MTHVLVLIANPARAGLHDSIARAVRDALGDAALRPGAVEWLAPGIAADIPFTGDPASARGSALAAMPKEAIDIAAVPAAGRRKKLLIADMESTLIENEFLDDIPSPPRIAPNTPALPRPPIAPHPHFPGA